MVWVDVANFVELELSRDIFPGGHCRVRVDLWTDTPGATIQARLQNVSDDLTVGTSAVVSATTPTPAGFSALLTDGGTTPGTSTAGDKAWAWWRFADDGTDNMTDGETVTIGTKTYVFKTTLTNTPGYVRIGASLVETLSCLTRAVVLFAPSAGIDYAASTVANERVRAWVERIKGRTAPDGGIYTDTMAGVEALVMGATGNTIPVSCSRGFPAGFGWVGEGNIELDYLKGGVDGSITPGAAGTRFYRLQVTSTSPDAALFAHGIGLVY